MCCCYRIENSRRTREIIEEMNRSPLVPLWRQGAEVITEYGEVRPTDIVPVIAPNKSGKRTVFPMKWGFSGKSLIINARTETAASKPTFRDSWNNRRCIVPASWYFEWEHIPAGGGKTRRGDKYKIRSGEELTMLCGLYRMENGLPSFVILTREPGESTRGIHNRMPLILPEKYADDWIRPDTRPEELLTFALTEPETKKVSPEEEETESRIRRIRYFEEIFREALHRPAPPALLAELEAYYTSGEWREDFEADEAGLLPPDLPRGVLSEDGIYNLLEDQG
ncbi:MAG: DUF4298 domain-containing protein [Clostridia bacterium]|nr:DUF4298 domain-containing protein [Clostridia bacterium]